MTIQELGSVEELLAAIATLSRQQRARFNLSVVQHASIIRILLLLLCLGVATADSSSAQPLDPVGLDLVCPLVAYERQQVLEDSQFEVELAENELRARKRVFEMVEKLWQARAIEQEIYLDYKRLHDRTKARLSLLATQIAQQRTAVEQYELVCKEVRSESNSDPQEKITRLQHEYRRLDCELLARQAELAEIDYVFDKAILEATRALAEGNIKSRYELVIDEYDLSQSKAKHESYRNRMILCKKRLAEEDEGRLAE